jgi:nucleoside-diphosphate-sugar epimerase
MKSTISILGCGWLGLPLGNFLCQKGFRVKGSVTSEEMFPALEQAGIAPSLLVLSPELSGENTESFFSCNVLIVNFPPERRADIEEYLPAQIQSLLEHINKHKVRKVLFVSSTSVYPDVNREVYEHENLLPAKGSGRALKVVEDMLLEQKWFVTTILRFGGLVGYDRLPGKYLASKKNMANADVPVNLIHRDDCIEIIYQIIRQEMWGEVFNACADKHPLRKDYYRQAAVKAGLEPPVFADHGPSAYKIINSEKLKSSLDYAFKYPDPIIMLDECCTF